MIVNDVDRSVLVVRDTGTARGRGVFAGQAIKRGTLVEAAPVVLVTAAWETIPLEFKKILYDWPAIGGRDAGHALALAYGSLFNSTNPANLKFRASACNGFVLYTAARDIASGEELMINYDSEDGRPESGESWWFEQFDEERVGD